MKSILSLKIPPQWFQDLHDSEFQYDCWVSRGGQGTIVKVQKCQNKQDCKPMAIKRIGHIFKDENQQTLDTEQPLQTLNEVVISTNLSDKQGSVLASNAAFVASNNKAHFNEVYLEMPYLEDYSDLYHILQDKYSDYITNKEDQHDIMYQLAQGVRYLNKMGIVYGDVKPENCMVRKDDKGLHAKIIDYGAAVMHKQNPKMHSERYRAPEVEAVGPESTGEYGYPADVWSLGVLFAEMLMRIEFDSPMHVLECFSILDPECLCNQECFHPQEEQHQVEKDKIRSLSPDAKDLLAKMLRLDPDQRITIEQVSKHPFFNKSVVRFEKQQVIFDDWFSFEFEHFTNNFEFQIKRICFKFVVCFHSCNYCFSLSS